MLSCRQFRQIGREREWEGGGGCYLFSCVDQSDDVVIRLWITPPFTHSPSVYMRVCTNSHLCLLALVDTDAHSIPHFSSQSATSRLTHTHTHTHTFGLCWKQYCQSSIQKVRFLINTQRFSLSNLGLGAITFIIFYGDDYFQLTDKSFSS